MYAIAIVGDLFSLIPFVNVATGIITALLLFMFAKKGESIYSRDPELTLLTLVIEFVTGVAMLPAFTLRVAWAKHRAKKTKNLQAEITQ